MIKMPPKTHLSPKCFFTVFINEVNTEHKIYTQLKKRGHSPGQRPSTQSGERPAGGAPCQERGGTAGKKERTKGPRLAGRVRGVWSCGALRTRPQRGRGGPKLQL